jgi:hypothetical protein
VEEPLLASDTHRNISFGRTKTALKAQGEHIRQHTAQIPILAVWGLGSRPEFFYFSLALKMGEGHSYFTNHYSPNDTDPRVQKVVKDYQSRYRTVPDALAATGYDAALIMFDAIKRAGSLDGAALRDVLAATRNSRG